MVFASGYNVFYGFVEPPQDVDVVMLAPRMIGQAVRDLYVAGKHFPCLVAVHQDVSGSAEELLMALYGAIGGDPNTCFRSSFREETLVDLFAEQFLWAGINKLCLMYFDYLVEAGCDPELVATELYLSGEMLEIAKAMIDKGFLKQLTLHSQTSQYGQLSRADRVINPEVAQTARDVLKEILSGDFAAEWEGEQLAGKPRLRKLKEQALAHPINQAEESLKSRAGWSV